MKDEKGEPICAVCGQPEADRSHGNGNHRFLNRDEFAKSFLGERPQANRPAAGPWIQVAEREPAPGTVVLGEWKDGSVQVVSWSPKSREGQIECGHRVAIYLANTAPGAVGKYEWPVRWAELNTER